MASEALTFPWRKPDGCSGHAHGHPSRSLLKGLPGPGWTGHRSARRARLKKNTAGSSAARGIHDAFRLFPAGTASRGPPNQACTWPGAAVRQRSSPSLTRTRRSKRIGATPVAKARGLRAKGDDHHLE